MALQRPLFICDHAERLICPLPLKIDTYRGCSTGCAYCSLNGLRTGVNVGNAVNVPDVNVQPNSARYIEKFFYKRKTGMERALIDQRSPVQIGVSADPLQPAEAQYHITLKVLKNLAGQGVPLRHYNQVPNKIGAGAIPESHRLSAARCSVFRVERRSGHARAAGARST